MRIAALLLLALAASACHATNAPAGGLNESQAAAAGVAPDPETVMQERWQKLFADPAAATAAANEFGYKVPGYAPAGGEYRARGVTQDFAGPADIVSVTTSFEANGKAADKIDTLRFSFDVRQKAAAQDKQERDVNKVPTRIVGGFLSRFGVGPGDEVRNAIARRASAAVTLHGTDITVQSQPLPGAAGPDDRRLIVTFNRPGTAVPASSKPQGT